MSRQAFQEAAGFFVRTVERVHDDRWTTPGLGVWTVRDLVGHACRALLTVETYEVEPGGRADLPRPVDYFLRARGTLAAPAAVAERGREAGKALGPEPAATVRAAADRTLARLDQLPDSTVLTTPIGTIRLIDYLPTRIFELTVHTLDIASAIDVEVEPPPAPMQVTLHLLADLALGLGVGPILALGSTGRRSLPEGFSVLG